LPTNAQQFKVRLASATGLSDSAIDAAWPEWWSDDADSSPSAQAELRFSIARNLGLDPRSLLDDEAPQFLWDDSAKYKNFSGDPQRDKPAITSFGISVARILVKGVGSHHPLEGITAASLRTHILRNQPFVRFVDLLALLWGVGVPTIHLRVFPLSAKRMCAMATKTGDRSAVLLAKDSLYPAPMAFHLAHEIGHIALGHVTQGSALIDMDDPAEHANDGDDEERAADAFALELLTGDPQFRVEKKGTGNNADELARQALAVGPAHQIEPGTLALCYGYTTNEWPTVQAAMKQIYTSEIPVWSVTNNIARGQLQWDQLSDENESFLRAVMGGV
jgi:hypothetical protein